MQKRNLFDRLKQVIKKPYGQSIIISQPTPFSNWSGDAYANDVVRSAVGSIARNAAKMQAKHLNIRGTQSSPAENSKFEYMLAVRPNKALDAYSFWQRTFTLLLLRGTVYIYIDRDYIGQEPSGLYIIMPEHVTLIETSNGDLAAKIKLKQGGETTLLYEDLIHLRRDLYLSDYAGTTTSDVMRMPLDVLQASNQGMINAVKQSATIRGIIKMTNSMLKPEQIKANRDQFVTDYLGIDNNGGIAGLDATSDFIPIKIEPQSLNKAQIDHAKQSIYDLYGVNAEFVSGKFTDSTWSAIYESVIEPLLIMSSLECTFKLFSERQHGFGNRIVFDSNRLQYTSVDTKIKVIQSLAPYGALTVDQCLSIFNLPTLGGEEGSKRLQTLNVVDAKKANEYQGIGTMEDENEKSENE